jgi:hypothetical protein
MNLKNKYIENGVIEDGQSGMKEMNKVIKRKEV